MTGSLIGPKQEHKTNLTNPMKFEDYSRNFLFFHDETSPELLEKYLPRRLQPHRSGAGDGVLLAALQHAGHLEKAKSIVAVDLSEDRCDRLRQCTLVLGMQLQTVVIK